MNVKKQINIYTDGACSGNPGPGGYCAVLKYQNHEKIIKGGEKSTTNNRMELTAVLKGLEAIKEPCDITIYSDSKYFIDAIEKNWVTKWQENNWMRNKKDPVLNVDLWKDILKQFKIHNIYLIWVKGHSGHLENDICDKIAVSESLKYKNI
ncbi:MAG: ribonuclease HI [Oscillospiraceae bacterium]